MANAKVHMRNWLYLDSPWLIMVYFQFKLSLGDSVVLNKFLRSAGSLQAP